MSITPVNDAIYTRLGNFIQAVLGAIPVVRGLDNRVPMPVEPFACMTPAGTSRVWMSASGDTYDRAGGTRKFEQHSNYRIQLDFYGPNSHDWATQVHTLATTEYGVGLLAPEVSPLLCEDIQQLPLVNGEEQFEQRWMFAIQLQFNPVIAVPQQFAEALEITVIEVDTTYPPGA